MKTQLLPILLCTTCIYANTSIPKQLFYENKMEYKGTKIEQTKLLMRKPLIAGHIDKSPVFLNPKFETLLNSKFSLDISNLNDYLKNNKISPQMIGGEITSPLSYIMVNNKKIYAKYFVIHDTSTPEFKDDFPNNINDQSFEFNDSNLTYWKKGKEPSHIILTRTGDSKTLVDFANGWRATKFETSILGKKSKGLFLHIELVQPRVFPPGKSGSAFKAPSPGFTDAQYHRLALIYICASARKGEWLIPAFHINIDETISDGHDDPQNFETDKFINAILTTLNKIQI